MKYNEYSLSTSSKLMKTSKGIKPNMPKVSKVQSSQILVKNLAIGRDERVTTSAIVAMSANGIHARQPHISLSKIGNPKK